MALFELKPILTPTIVERRKKILTQYIVKPYDNSGSKVTSKDRGKLLFK